MDSIVPFVENIVPLPKDKIRFYIKVHQIISQKELTEHDKQVKKNKKIEDSTLTIFVSKHYPKAEKKSSGLYILQHTLSQGVKAEYGDTISVYYSVSDTLNNVLDKNTDGKPFEFVLGDDGLIAGWSEGLSYMKKGEKMRIWQKLLLILLVLTLIAVAILTWGSIGSAVMVLCLISLCSALLFQKFLTNRDAGDYQMED